MEEQLGFTQAIWRRQIFHVSIWEISLTTYVAKWTVFSIAKMRKFHHTWGRCLNNHLKINTNQSFNLTKTYIKGSCISFQCTDNQIHSLCREMHWVQLRRDSSEIIAFVYSCLKKYVFLQPPLFCTHSTPLNTGCDIMDEC